MISVYNCGIDSNHQKPLDSFHPKSPDYVLLLVKTDVCFDVNGQIMHTAPDVVILYEKGAYIRYWRNAPLYNDDWIHFDIEEADESFLLSLDIPFNTPCRVSSFDHLTEYARLIVAEKNSTRQYKKDVLDLLMRTLLYSLASFVHMKPDEIVAEKHFASMLELRKAIRLEPQKHWTVKMMAQHVHMSPSYFQHLYKTLFDTSSIQDLIWARIKKARSILRTSDHSIDYIAELCGYTNGLHFMRQFKKIEGVTPSTYRKLHRQKR